MIKYKNILIILILLTVTKNATADTLTSLTINPDSRINLYFNENLNQYDSELSDNKKNIIISLPDTYIKDDARRLIGKGEIDDIFANSENNNAIVNIYLKKEKGYTAIFLPFSNKIAVDIFEWNKLEKSEDHYRTALLGIEDDIYSATLSELTKAASMKHPDAAAVLGILLIEGGFYEQAENMLLLAEALGTSIEDVYAALALIYNKFGSNDLYLKYENKFKEIHPDIEISDIQVNSELSEYISPDDYIFADSLLNVINSEKALKSEKDSVLNDNFKELFAESDTADTLSGASDNFFPWWTEFAVMIIAIILLFIVYRYLKWRNKQLIQLQEKEKKQNDFKEELKKSQKSIKPKSNIAAKTYANAKKRESNLNQAISKKANEEKAGINKLNEIIEKKRAETPPAQNEEKPPQVKRKKMSPKIELAMHLAKEQQNIKNRNISSIYDKELPADADKLNAVAKKLGIEKGSLEVKNAIDNISKDPEKVAKLTEKFSQFGKDLK